MPWKSGRKKYLAPCLENCCTRSCFLFFLQFHTTSRLNIKHLGSLPAYPGRKKI